MTTGSFSQYAAHAGVSPAYVSKLKKQGRIVMRQVGDKDVVDFDLTDRKVKGTGDMGRARNGANSRPERAPVAPPARVADSGRIDTVFRQAQAQERAYSAKLLELKYRKECGELIEAASVKSELGRQFGAIREGLLNVAARVTPMLSLSGPQASLLDAEIRAVLAQYVGEA